MKLVQNEKYTSMKGMQSPKLYCVSKDIGPDNLFGTRQGRIQQWSQAT